MFRTSSHRLIRRVFLSASLATSLTLLGGCKSAPVPNSVTIPAAQASAFPPRPTVPPPPFKIFHQDNDTYTLVTTPAATDDEISAILYQLRDAAHAHTFAALQLSQSFVDARKPIVWFHVYRGPKCAGEKFTKGKLPCDPSYHGAGDYTLGDYKNPNWEDAALFRTNGVEVHLWNPDAVHP